MTEVKRLTMLYTNEEVVPASDYDQLQRELEALRVENAELVSKCSEFENQVRIVHEHYEVRLAKALAALVQFREQAAWVCRLESVDADDTKHPEDFAYNRATEDCANAVSEIPLPSSAERISKVLEAAMSLELTEDYQITSESWGRFREAVRELEEAW